MRAAPAVSVASPPAMVAAGGVPCAPVVASPPAGLAAGGSPALKPSSPDARGLWLLLDVVRCAAGGTSRGHDIHVVDVGDASTSSRSDGGLNVSAKKS